MSLDWDAVKEKKKSTEQDIETDQEKILFTGLDNSGKTSIILALQRQYARIAVLKPTRQTQRRIFTYLGNTIAEWDLGGQARYRIAYIKQPGRYFDNTSVCVYTLDIQEMGRFEESVSYFSDVLQKFEDLNLSPPIYVFLHKFDPDWVEESPGKRGDVINLVEGRFREINADRHQLFFQTTSIFDPWSIMSAFSEILLLLYPKSELVDRTIQEFANKLEADGILVLDQNALILGQYFRTPEDREIFKSTTPHFLTLHDGFVYQKVESSSMGVEVGGSFYLFSKLEEEGATEPRYLLIKKGMNEFDNAEIQSFSKVFFNLLRAP
ncbi:MAG: ADP-ribosylation factor-like protein [Promethearchaeota archaeon]